MRLEGVGFWQRVNKTEGCWLWIGSKTSAGYGDLNFMRHHVLAHRLAWTIEHGEIPKGLLVLHRCDTPLCVRPDHLFLGTDADNHADKQAKGRDPSMGEGNFHRKLTAAQVVEIRQRYTKRISRQDNGNSRQLGREYGISHGQVHAIVARRAWKHIL